MSLKTKLFSGWRKWVTLAVLVILAVILVHAAAGKDLAVWWLLRGLEDDPEHVAIECRKLGLPYLRPLSRALLRGGRSFDLQLYLTRILIHEPFFAREVALEALRDGEVAVARAAATALLRADTKIPPGKVPDDLLPVMLEWMKEPGHPWLYVGLIELGWFQDRRLVEPLLELVSLPAKATGTDLLEVGRTNASRGQAAKVLRRYLEEPGVLERLAEVLGRENEVDEVQMELVKSLANSGFSANLEIYRIASRSSRTVMRQVVASHLEFVKDSRVNPILLFLTEDVNEIVRRNAITSLIRKRAPVVMDEIRYWGEDFYVYIRGDLASAVDIYQRRDLLSFAVWCLLCEDDVVVEKALVALFRLTKEHYGFEKVWERYTWNRPLEGGARGRARSEIIKQFMIDEERKAKAIEAWSKRFPPRYSDDDRAIHLVRMLGHADSRNVQRAIRELVRIKGWKDDFPQALWDRSTPEGKQADARFLFVKSDRTELLEKLRRRLE